MQTALTGNVAWNARSGFLNNHKAWFIGFMGFIGVIPTHSLPIAPARLGLVWRAILCMLAKSISHHLNKPWNDSIPQQVNTKKYWFQPWFQSGAKWFSFIHSRPACQVSNLTCGCGSDFRARGPQVLVHFPILPGSISGPDF